MKKVIIIGANSEIGWACAQQFKAVGYSVVLAAHKPAELPSKEFEIQTLDVTKWTESSIDASLYDCVVYIAGKLGDNEELLHSREKDISLEVNFNAPVHILSHFALTFKERRNGTIVGVSSVAAVRGKGGTVIYGATKAGLDSFLAGLRNYLFPFNVHVLTVRPGYVATKMTQHLTLPKHLTATSEEVARKIVKAVIKKKNVLYVKAIWRPLMFVIRNIPEFIFKRMKL